MNQEYAAMVDNVLTMFVEYSGMLGYFSVSEYHWDDSDAGGTWAKIVVDDDGKPEFTINAETVNKGYENLKNGDIVNVAKKDWICSRIERAKLGDEDADDFDLEDADIIVQAAIFGKLVYG